jgi:putative dehydrogenase
MADSTNKKCAIAIIGMGEMGSAVGLRLRECGARVLTTLTGRSAASIERVGRARLEVVEDDDALVDEADLVLSIVPPGQAMSVAERFRGPLASNKAKPAFVECNAISPATIRLIADSLAATGCKIIDAGIIGGPPPAGRIDKGPRFYASGPDAELLTQLRQYGIDIAIVEGPLGAASALKMSYAGLTKGFIAIGAAMIAGASRAGLSSALATELQRSQPGILAMLCGWSPGMFPKAYRWVAEMEQIAEFLGGDDRGRAIYEGAARLYESIAHEWEQSGEGSAMRAAVNSFVRGTGFSP